MNVPKAYGDPKSTPLSAKVSEGFNKFDFEVKVEEIKTLPKPKPKTDVPARFGPGPALAKKEKLVVRSSHRRQLALPSPAPISFPQAKSPQATVIHAIPAEPE
ncbi:MAG: hypothetical protein KatS3mg105_0129 [Gemmatales bacterium]|nr:MAG: hypothetical protein KatS3mg105_0129 [Gemmatales bacterium]